ncbi:hypothetical protein A2V80_02730 [Candidatus Woesebacteria bacterium RBG_16_39_8b]|uniref:Uncharacterized protein n=1 Tax=Candidatus Woesebacteria bacterium RBG_16_39_8b TaxID=1802482 RepID=A0A1F7XBQ1_9BACT|nr:MAG: hypothetical protein A2V80_02730 [Candidatus Woesebacteria bacterium RBG_16_39_8b]
MTAFKGKYKIYFFLPSSNDIEICQIQTRRQTMKASKAILVLRLILGVIGLGIAFVTPFVVPLGSILSIFPITPRGVVSFLGGVFSGASFVIMIMNTPYWKWIPRIATFLNAILLVSFLMELPLDVTLAQMIWLLGINVGWFIITLIESILTIIYPRK